MTTPQFSDLTEVPTQQQVLDTEVLPQLASNGVNVTSWVLGDPYRTLAMAVAKCRQLARQALAAAVCAGFEDYVFGRATPPGGLDVTGWAPFVARNRYGILQKLATYTQRTITLTNTSPTPYSSLQPGSIIIAFPSGNRYFLQGGQTQLTVALGASDTSAVVASTVGFPTSGTLLVDNEQISYTGLTASSFTGLVRGANGTVPSTHALNAAVAQVITIPASGSIAVTFRSEFPFAVGATYNTDLPGSTIALVTSSFPGVQATNTAPSYSPVAQAGSGLGTITAGGTPTGNHNVTVQITGTGSVAGANVQWSTSLDGAPFVPQSGSSVANLGGFGISITLSDNGGGTNAFVQSCLYYVSTPGTDITQVGAAAETPQALGQRCAGMWPLLPFLFDQFGNFVPPASPTTSAYVALALSGNKNVVIAFVQQDAAINNLLHLYVAGQGGASLPPTVVANVQQFFQSFNMLTDQVVAATPTGRSVSVGMTGGAILCKSSLLASAQQTMQQRLATYLGGTDPVQPLGINGLIDFDYLLAIIRTTPGVTRVTGTLTITTSAGTVSTDVQLPIAAGAVEVAQWSQAGSSMSSVFPFQTS
jgi:hypothetical protein